MVSIERKKVIIVSNYFVQGEVDDLPLWKKFRDISIKEYSQLYAVSIIVQKPPLWTSNTFFGKRN